MGSFLIFESPYEHMLKYMELPCLVIMVHIEILILGNFYVLKYSIKHVLHI